MLDRGGSLPESAKKCIESWKKYCPDYEIKEWNEYNLEIDSCAYMREAYEERAWGFVPDVARLQIIFQNGGIYLDTDVEIIKPFDQLLECSAFVGFECKDRINLGHGFGAEKGNPVIGGMLEDYRERHFRLPDGSLNRTASPTFQSAWLKAYGVALNDRYQKLEHVTVFPTDYFCPLSFKTGKLKITKRTFSIHHFDGSWLTQEEKERNKARWTTYRKYGVFASCFFKIKRSGYILKNYGLKAWMHKAFEKIFHK